MSEIRMPDAAYEREAALILKRIAQWIEKREGLAGVRGFIDIAENGFALEVRYIADNQNEPGN